MHITKPLSIAALFFGLANPAIAQTDPHHPEGADTTTTETETPADGAPQPPPPQAGSAMTQCPDMMGMMQPGEGQVMPMMHMHMMAMMQMHMHLMQQMPGHGTGGMMQPGADDAPQMQMMEMMRSMQMMQMDMMQIMQQMQENLAAPEAPAEGATP
jgi:hypothetical protein